MDNRRLSLRGLFIVLMLALLTGACQFVLGPRPTEEVTPSRTPAPSRTPEPATTPTAALPYPPPNLLFRTPEKGEAQALDAPIALTFDEPMDGASVTRAFAISPTVTGDLYWTDARTLVFSPAEPLARDTRYRVTVDRAARNIEGTALADPIAFDFRTVGHLLVSDVQPAPDSEDIAPDTAVTVVFNRPVVPLTGIDQQHALPDPLTFVPPVRGEGEWLNTSIYRFYPDEGFHPATLYTARIAAGLSDTTGSAMETDYTWRFTTVRPDVLAWSPTTEAAHIDPGAAISVTFNQAMDHAVTESAFTMTVDGQRVDGRFRWNGGSAPLDSETMTFIPGSPLPRDARVHARVATTARARSGDATLRDELSWRFYTVKSPGILYTSPFNNETGVAPYSDILFTFASPMQRDGFMEYARIIPAPTEVYTYWTESDTELRLSLGLEPATVYNITINGDAPDRYGEPLGRSFTLRFTTGDLSPYATLNTGATIGTFDAYTDTAIYVSYRNVSRLDAKLYQVSPETFMQLHAYGSFEYRDAFQPSASDLIRSWSVNVNPPRNQARLTRMDIVDANLEPLLPGIYLLELTAPEVGWDNVHYRPARYTFIRSRVNLTLKKTATESLIWATDLASGQPVPNLDLRLNHKDTGWFGHGTTDADGLLLTTDEESIDLWDDYFAFAGNPGDADFAIAFSNWDYGIRPWNFDLNGDFGQAPYAGHLYTDRPIYRPGQTIYFKGIVRADDDATYTIPADIRALNVQITDPQGKEIYNTRLPLNDMGTLAGECALDDFAPLGTYYIQMVDDAGDFYASTGVRLAEYRAPEFQVNVTPDRDAYHSGDSANVTVEAAYYFGGAVANAAIQWSVLSSGYAFDYQCPRGDTCPTYSWVDYTWEDGTETIYGRYGRLVAQGDATTDAQGRAVLRIPIDIRDDLSSRRFTFEATVTDINDQTVSNRTAAIVHKGEFYIGLAPQGRIAQAGEEKALDILTVNWDSEPVAAGALTVVFMEHRWYNVRQEAEDGQYYWTWTVEDIPIYTTTVTTGATGKAVATFVPPTPGSYRVRVTGSDARGNDVRSSAYVWVWGDGAAYWRRENTNRIDLITDKETYRVGDVAEILIPSPYGTPVLSDTHGTVNALVTIERGHIIETAVMQFTSGSEVLRVPIEAHHAPNIFVSVILVQGSAQSPDALATFKMGEVLLPVSVEEKQLTITLMPDRPIDSGDHYRPRETAVYDVLVTDHAGSPVEAELSLGLTDLAVLALAGEAEGPTLLERFWSQRGLAVRTSMPLAVAMEAYNRELAPLAKGGGGGDEAGGFIRSEFADTAFWDPVVRTGADGRARVNVTLPDNLTTWRMQARGITAETLVGQSRVDVVSTLDLLVRPVLPRFFVVGDRAEIATIVHNNTGEAQAVEVTLTVAGLDVEGATRQTATIPAGDKVKFVWPVTARAPRLAEHGEAAAVTVQMEARAGALYDGRKDTLPLYTYAAPEIIGTAGRLSEPEARQEIIQLPPIVDPTQGELTVRVDASLTGVAWEAMDYLKSYPYACVEQTVSRFLPNVLIYQAFTEMQIERDGLKDELAEQIGVAMQRLYAQQHYDGGWGWWRTDVADPYLTAYVLHGMLEVHRAGFTVDLDVIHKAAGFLRARILAESESRTSTMSHWQANRLAYQLYTLGEYLALVKDAKPAGELGRAIRLFDDRHLLDTYGRATLAVALMLLEPGEARHVNTLLSDLNGEAVYSATGTHWEEAQPDPWNMSTDVRTTAMVLWAMARHNGGAGDSDLLPNIARWLMSTRDRDGTMQRLYWESTHTTSWVLTGLIAYMRATGELRGAYSYVVTLNGEIELTGDVDASTIDASAQTAVPLAHLLADAANRLIIERLPPQAEQQSAGQLYYTAHLRYFRPVEQVTALDRGIIVARQYSLVDAGDGHSDAVVDSARAGDVIRVKLTLIAPTDLYYVVVEDPLPAGCEAVDVTLNTTSVVGEQPEARQLLTSAEEAVWYRRYGWGWWWFSHSEIRDEKVALFATYLPRGTYEYSYIMRASVPGTYNVIPATAYEMYFPEVFGRSDGGRFVVKGE